MEKEIIQQNPIGEPPSMNRKIRHQTTIRLNEQVNRILDSKAKDLEISRNAVINMILKKVFSGQPIHI